MIKHIFLSPDREVSRSSILMMMTALVRMDVTCLRTIEIKYYVLFVRSNLDQIKRAKKKKKKNCT